MGAGVLLLHELHGTTHHDWLFEREPGGPLAAFRTPDRVDALPDCFHATRLRDHRSVYLTYEGEISGGRGVVRRLAAGSCRVLACEPALLHVEVEFGGVRREYRGVAADPSAVDASDGWIFRAVSGTPR